MTDFLDKFIEMSKPIEDIKENLPKHYYAIFKQSMTGLGWDCSKNSHVFEKSYTGNRCCFRWHIFYADFDNVLMQKEPHTYTYVLQFTIFKSYTRTKKRISDKIIVWRPDLFSAADAITFASKLNDYAEDELHPKLPDRILI